MKNFKFFLSLVILTSSIFSLRAQSELAMVDFSIEKTFKTVSVEETDLKIDKTAISELSKFLTDEVQFPFSQFDYANEVSATVQISLNQVGEVIDYKIVMSSNDQIERSILNTLSKLERVSPIRVNGIAQSYTIQLPLIFKS